MALNIRYEGYKVWNMYISPLYDFDNHEFIKNMNEKVAELKEWVDKNSDSDNFDNADLEKLINCYVEIANADDFIHENEVTLIQHAIESWSMDIVIDKPKSGEKLKVKNS